MIAPMAGISNKAFRKILRTYTKGLICCEMVSDKGIAYQNKRTLEMIQVEENEGLISLQVFGGDVESILNAAKYIDKHSNCAIIDINMGCPVKKVLKTGGGALLLNDPTKIKEIVSQVVKNVSKPVSVKIRLGYDNNNINYLEVGKIIEEAGADMIILHARTKAQLYKGNADWQAIKKLKEELKIPVVGNGDIKTLDDAIKMKELTNCDAIMIGRGVLGNPWLAKEIETYFLTGQRLSLPSYEDRIIQAIEHLDLACNELGEKIGTLQMRSHGAWYLKGIPGNAQIRQSLNKANSKEEMKQIFIDYLNKITK
jgi:nifR3 family TIM-barrel protein